MIVVGLSLNILNSFDYDDNGSIEYQEYLIGLCDKNMLFSNFNLKRFFNVLDKDKKGYLNSQDIKYFAFQNKTVNNEAFTEYLKQFGMKINDKLNFDDFANIIKNNCSLDYISKSIINGNNKKENILNDNELNIYEDIKNDN